MLTVHPNTGPIVAINKFNPALIVRGCVRNYSSGVFGFSGLNLPTKKESPKVVRIINPITMPAPIDIKKGIPVATCQIAYTATKLPAITKSAIQTVFIISS